MKKYILILTLCIPVLGFSQDTVGMHLPVKDGKLIYEGILNVPDKNKMDLYSDAKKWFTDYSIDSRDVIQNEDKDQGRIIGKGIIIIPYKVLINSLKLYCLITIEIDVKDAKYRYRIYDIILDNIKSRLYQIDDSSLRLYPEQLIAKLTGHGKSGFTKSQCRQILIALDLDIKSTVAFLIKTMDDKSDNF